MNQITNLLQKNIKLIDKVSDWKTAIRLAVKPLLEEGVITEAYQQAIIQSVYDNGPYMVIGDEFALLHARPGVDVKSVGLSLLITKEAVNFEGKFVKIFLVLAATDNTSHLESLKQLINIFMDEKKFQTIKQGTIQDIQSILQQEEG